MRRAGHGDLVLEVPLGDARLAAHALEGEQAAHVGGAEGELAGLVGLPVPGRGPAGLADHVRGQVVAQVPVFFEKLIVGHGLDDFNFRRVESVENGKDMLADMLPHLLLEKNALGLALGIDDVSDGSILVHWRLRKLNVVTVTCQ